MMYCSFCKKQIEDDALFCPYCGKSTPQGDALADLAAAARTGDQDAIGALYEKTYSKVYYTVKSMIKDEDAVLDVVQDTYIKAFAHLDSFQGDMRFLPWVRQIAANTARNWLKKKRPMLFTELNSGDGQDTPVEEQFPDELSDNLPDQIIDQKETKRLIREIIEELPEDQRAVIGMFYYEEMSVKEIAAAMGISESAVKSRLMYGRNKIEKKSWNWRRRVRSSTVCPRFHSCCCFSAARRHTRARCLTAGSLTPFLLRGARVPPQRPEPPGAPEQRVQAGPAALVR